MNKKAAIAERFTGFEWHDSVLKSIKIERSGAEYEIWMRVTPPGSSSKNFTDIEAHFVGARAISTDIDLLSLRFCSGMIWDSDCYTDIASLETSRINLESLPDLTPDTIDLDRIMLFSVSLVPPSGRIVVLAEDFYTCVA